MTPAEFTQETLRSPVSVNFLSLIPWIAVFYAGETVAENGLIMRGARGVS